MPALQLDDDAPVPDPDELKVPENAQHRQVVDVVALAATGLLGSHLRIFSDMNWYPPDDGNAVAPDIMVVPTAAIEATPKSYRQDQTGGPPPTVVVEIPSPTDSFVSFRAKAFRYRSLGTVTYVIVVGGSNDVVLRLGPDDPEPQPWTDRPIDELGGLRLGFADGELVVTTPHGLSATSDQELLEAEAQSRAATAEARAATLAERLRQLGVDPDEP